ncbi:hypothetical protein PG988_004006 [Apiospora saccharicola]
MVVSCPQLAGAISQLRCRSFGLRQLAAGIRSPECKCCGRFGDLFYLITAELRAYIEKPSQLGSRISRYRRGATGPWGKGVISKRCIAFDRTSFFAEFDAQRQGGRGPILEYRSAEPDVLSYVSTIRAPYLDDISQRWEEGFSCRACASRDQEHAGGDAGVTSTTNSYPRNCYPAWDLPYRRYTRDGIKHHLEQYGNIYKLASEGESCVQYAHENPFDRWFSGDDEANELTRMSELLRACREKKAQLAPLQVFLPNWYSVPTMPSLLRHRSFP